MTTLRLLPEDLVEAEASYARGSVPVILSLSAFDIPHSISVDRKDDAISITFQYLGHEEPVKRDAGPGLSVIVGKNSGKVLGFVAKRTSQQPRDITVRIVRGVEEELKRATRPNQRMNYKLIDRVVRTKLEPLLAGT